VVWWDYCTILWLMAYRRERRQTRSIAFQMLVRLTCSLVFSFFRGACICSRVSNTYDWSRSRPAYGGDNLPRSGTPAATVSMQDWSQTAEQTLLKRVEEWSILDHVSPRLHRSYMLVQYLSFDKSAVRLMLGFALSTLTALQAKVLAEVSHAIYDEALGHGAWFQHELMGHLKSVSITRSCIQP